MSEKNEIEDWAVNEFSELVQFGFTPPVIIRNGWGISIDWFYRGIAVELEIDVRESAVFCLLVRLEDGQLPDGYYVSNRKPCRIHLQKLIRERGWPVDYGSMSKISHQGQDKPTSDLTTVRDAVSAYKFVVMQCLERVQSEAEALFEK